MPNATDIIKIGPAVKFRYDDGALTYKLQGTVIDLEKDEETFKIKTTTLHPDNPRSQIETTSVFGDISITYGMPNAEAYIEYLINNGFFLPTHLISDIDGETARVTKGALDTNTQDQFTPSVDSYFIKSVSNFSLALDTPVSTVTTLEYDFTAAPGHGMVIGNEILLLDVVGDRSFQAMVLNVAGDVITTDRPIDHLFPAATALGRIVTSEMAVDGSITPQIFSVRAGVVPSDIIRTLLTMTGTTAMDDGKFGSLPALTRGLVFRIVNGRQQTIFNFKTNQEIKQFCFDVNYSDKAPAGQYGLSARMSFGGQDKHGVTLRISGLSALQWIVQDNLTGALSIKTSDQGHEVEN